MKGRMIKPVAALRSSSLSEHPSTRLAKVDLLVRLTKSRLEPRLACLDRRFKGSSSARPVMYRAAGRGPVSGRPGE
jgi:hypothetical protein